MLKIPCLVLDHDDTVVQTERAIGYPYFRDFIERIRPGMTLSFESYVQQYYFKQVVAAANRRLSVLTDGMFTLRCKEEARNLVRGNERLYSTRKAAAVNSPRRFFTRQIALC